MGNNLPGYGDIRIGKRQLLTISDVKVFSGTIVNEMHLGYNRIHLPFDPQSNLTSAPYGIDNGVVAFPQIIIGGGELEFGDNANEPTFRGDYTAVLSDSLSWVHGKHTVKFGGEFRRNDANAYTLSPGSFTFATIAAFLADQAIGFTANASDRSSRIFVNDLGAYMQDSYKVIPNVMLEFGLRYDWNGTPVEAESRFVEFDPATVSLVEVGRPAGPTEAYNQSALNIEPRVGFSWDLFKSGKTVLRSAYALQNDAPTTAAATPLASNPPFADPVSFSPTASVPYGSFTNAYSAAGGVVSPTTIVPNYKSDYV